MRQLKVGILVDSFLQLSTRSKKKRSGPGSQVAQKSQGKNVSHVAQQSPAKNVTKAESIVRRQQPKEYLSSDEDEFQGGEDVCYMALEEKIPAQPPSHATEARDKLEVVSLLWR